MYTMLRIGTAQGSLTLLFQKNFSFSEIIKNGDNEAREKFIGGNLRLVLSVIQRFGRKRRKYR